VNDQTPEASLNAAMHLYLRELGEPGDNSFRVVVEEAISGPPGKSARLAILPKNLGKLFSDARPIISDSSCFSYELIWPAYVAYAVRNESFATVADKQTYEGTWLRRYSSSLFLDFVAKGTWADRSHPGPFIHWGLITLNHIVDIASVNAPDIRRFKNT